MTDEERALNRELVAHLISENYIVLGRLAVRAVGETGLDPDEVLHAAIIGMLNCPSFDTSESGWKFTTWAYKRLEFARKNAVRKTRNVRVNERDFWSRARPFALAARPKSPTPTDPIDRVSDWIAAHLRDLTESERRLVIGRFIDEREWIDLAVAEGISPQTAKGRTTWAIMRIRKMLNGHAVRRNGTNGWAKRRVSS